MEPEKQIYESKTDDSESIKFDAEEQKYLGLHPHAVKTRSPAKPNRLGFTSVMCLIINRVVGTVLQILLFSAPSLCRQELAYSELPQL